MLEVTNNNQFTIRDMFDGVPVEFPPGVTIDCPPNVAQHCFGYPGELADRAAYMAKRYGWAGRDYLAPVGLGDATPRYVTLAAAIAIKPVFYDLVKRDPNAPIPLDTGDEGADRISVPDADTTTKVGKRKKVAAPRAPRIRRDRHSTGRDEVRLGSSRR